MSTPWQELGTRVTGLLDEAPSRIPVVVGPDGSGRSSLLRRLATASGPARGQVVDLERITSTPERFLGALTTAAPYAAPKAKPVAAGPEGAFSEALRTLAGATTADGSPATFLLDEWLEWRTFEHFPGLRDAIPRALTALVEGTTRVVLTSRFVQRSLRALAAAPARFVVVPMPDMDAPDIAAELMQKPGMRSDTAEEFAQITRALTGGRAVYVDHLLRAMANGVDEPVSALVSCLVSEGSLDRHCRAAYQARLQRARGYGALKAVLEVLALEEPLSLTDIAVRLGRTPGSTRDYLWWLEDVDLVTARRKQYTFSDPLLRLWVALSQRRAGPDDETVAAGVQRFAIAQLSIASVRSTG